MEWVCLRNDEGTQDWINAQSFWLTPLTSWLLYERLLEWVKSHFPLKYIKRKRWFLNFFWGLFKVKEATWLILVTWPNSRHFRSVGFHNIYHYLEGFLNWTLGHNVWIYSWLRLEKLIIDWIVLPKFRFMLLHLSQYSLVCYLWELHSKNDLQ